MSNFQKRQDAMNTRLRALELLQAKMGQSIWLTRFTLGALLTIALAGGAGMAQLNREVVRVKTIVTALGAKNGISAEMAARTSWIDSTGAECTSVLRRGEAPGESRFDLPAGARRPGFGRFAERREPGAGGPAGRADRGDRGPLDW